MANHYIQASFMIKCTREQADIATGALSEVSTYDDEMSDWAKSVIKRAADDTFTLKETILRECFFNHPDQSDDIGAHDHSSELFWDFDAVVEDDGIWVSADESINTDHAAIFTSAVLKAFEIDDLVVIEAAHTCSKPQLDAFGGHAVVVSKDHIEWDSTQQFIAAERQANKDEARYYYCGITEVNGEYEYTSNFLMKCIGEKTEDERLNEILLGYRGDGEEDEIGRVIYPGGLGAQDASSQKITPHEYQMMSKYLGTL